MSFRDSFEKQLKDKVSQRSTNRLTDEAYLVKSFKFFDIYDKGQLTYRQFHQAIEKMGLYYTLQVRFFLP